MYHCQNAVKDARLAYFPRLLSQNNFNLKILFKIIGSVSAPSAPSPVPEVGLSQPNQHQVSHPAWPSLSFYSLCQFCFFHQFSTNNHYSNRKGNLLFEPSPCILDIIPTELLKEKFPTISTVISKIIHSFLASCSLSSHCWRKPNPQPLSL